MDTDLSLVDVEFLRTVRDINANPDAYEATDAGEVPATTSAIRVGSDLSRGEVKYRVDQGNRLLEDRLITLYEAEFDPESRTFGPKSVEVTERGIEALSTFDSGGDKSEAIRQLESRIDRLENADFGDEVDATQVSAELQSIRGSLESIQGEVNQLSKELESVRSAAWGAIDEDIAGDLDSVLRKTPAMIYLFSALFGTDVGYVAEEGMFDEDELHEAKRSVLDELGVESGAAVADQQGEQSEFAAATDSGGNTEKADETTEPRPVPSGHEDDTSE